MLVGTDDTVVVELLLILQNGGSHPSGQKHIALPVNVEKRQLS